MRHHRRCLLLDLRAFGTVTKSEEATLDDFTTRSRSSRALCGFTGRKVPSRIGIRAAEVFPKWHAQNVTVELRNDLMETRLSSGLS